MTVPPRDAAWVASLRTGGALCYDWQQRRGTLALPADGDLPTMAEVCALFEAVDARCVKVVIVDRDGVLASYEREILSSVPWWDLLNAGEPLH